MNRRVLASDKKPGKLPTIQSVKDSITYVMPIDDVHPDVQLTLRCDAQGNVFISATPTTHP
jgi:hypothetical protein